MTKIREAIIEEYPMYKVREDGTVYSMYTNKVLLPNIARTGYHTVELFKDKKSKRVLIHRLVAMAFVPNDNNYPCVNHKDENKNNNRADNLEWCTYKYNMNYGTATQRRKASTMWFYQSERLKSMARENGKVVSRPIEQLTKDGKHIAYYASIKEAYDATGIRHIADAAKGGKYKSAGGYLWKYIKEE